MSFFNLDRLTLPQMVALRDELQCAIVDAGVNPMAYPKPFKVRSDALRQSAKGQTCTVRLPGFCNHNAATTVLAHLPGGGSGTGTKGDDTHAAYACSDCHDFIDRRRQSKELSGAIVLDAMLRGLAETHHRMIEAGLLKVEGWEP